MLKKTEFIKREKGELYSKIKELEDTLIKRGQSEKTIFLNKSKEIKFSKWTYDGLSFKNHKISEKVTAKQLYDFNLMNDGITKHMVFVGHEEEVVEEEYKRSSKLKSEIPFDYQTLNEYVSTGPQEPSELDTSLLTYPDNLKKPEVVREARIYGCVWRN